MTDTTHNFDPIPRLQQIAATIRERGGYTFDAPATAAYYIECSIKEIERLRQENATLTAERDEARREVCRLSHEAHNLACEVAHYPKNAPSQQEYAKSLGWDCFKEDSK